MDQICLDPQDKLTPPPLGHIVSKTPSPDRTKKCLPPQDNFWNNPKSPQSPHKISSTKMWVKCPMNAFQQMKWVHKHSETSTCSTLSENSGEHGDFLMDSVKLFHSWRPALLKAQSHSTKFCPGHGEQTAACRSDCGQRRVSLCFNC